MNAAHIMIVAMSLFGGSLKQGLEPDPAKWARLAFPRTEVELAFRVPPDYVPMDTRGGALTPLAADSIVTLFQSYYDYGRAEDGNAGQFRVGAALVRLSRRPANGISDGRALLNATKAALKHPPSEPDILHLVTIHGREWLHYAGKSNTEGRYESFATLIGADEVLFVSANYQKKILRNKKWLASRQKIMRQVMEQVIVIEQQ